MWPTSSHLDGKRLGPLMDDASQSEPPVKPRRTRRAASWRRIRNYFLTGLVVAGPVAITFYLTWWFVNWVDGFVRPFVPVDYRPETYLPFAVPGSGLVVAFLALTLLGFLTANLIGRSLVDLGERLLGRMPVVRAIYRGLKQVFETLFSGNGNRASESRVGRISVARDVVDRADLNAAEPRSLRSCRRTNTCRFSCPARRIRPQASSSTCHEQSDRDRHDGRSRGDVDHVGGRRAAQVPIRRRRSRRWPPPRWWREGGRRAGIGVFAAPDRGAPDKVDSISRRRAAE